MPLTDSEDYIHLRRESVHVSTCLEISQTEIQSEKAKGGGDIKSSKNQGLISKGVT